MKISSSPFQQEQNKIFLFLARTKVVVGSLKAVVSSSSGNNSSGNGSGKSNICKIWNNYRINR